MATRRQEVQPTTLVCNWRQECATDVKGFIRQEHKCDLKQMRPKAATRLLGAAGGRDNIIVEKEYSCCSRNEILMIFDDFETPPRIIFSRIVRASSEIVDFEFLTTFRQLSGDPPERDWQKRHLLLRHRTGFTNPLLTFLFKVRASDAVSFFRFWCSVF